MATIPFWHQDARAEEFDGPIRPAGAWDLCTIGGFDLPGLAKVNVIAAMKIDIQKASGRDGAMLIEQGYVPAQVDIELTMWRPDQLQEWAGIVQKIWRKSHKPGKADLKQDKSASAAQVQATERAALAIEHPTTQLMDVAAVLIQSISAPAETGQFGFYSVRIKALEFNAAAKRTGKSATKRTTAGTEVNVDKRVPEQRKTTPARPSSTDRGPKGPPPAPSEGST